MIFFFFLSVAARPPEVQKDCKFYIAKWLVNGIFTSTM